MVNSAPGSCQHGCKCNCCCMSEQGLYLCAGAASVLQHHSGQAAPACLKLDAAGDACSAANSNATCLSSSAAAPGLSAISHSTSHKHRMLIGWVVVGWKDKSLFAYQTSSAAPQCWLVLLPLPSEAAHAGHAQSCLQQPCGKLCAQAAVGGCKHITGCKKILLCNPTTGCCPALTQPQLQQFGLPAARRC